MNALLIIDVQNDFCPGGALAVPEGDQVVPIINRIQPYFDLVVATQDWHPPEHGSYAASHADRQPGEVIDLHGLPQVLWPVHCVANTPGAEFHPALDRSRIAKIFRKGVEPHIDSYSGFFDNGHRRSTGLDDYLKSHGVRDVYLAGLTTDYCVKFTALDAVALGFRTHLIQDACRGVNLNPGDVLQAINEMHEARVKMVTSADIVRSKL